MKDPHRRKIRLSRSQSPPRLQEMSEPTLARKRPSMRKGWRLLNVVEQLHASIRVRDEAAWSKSWLQPVSMFFVAT